MSSTSRVSLAAEDPAAEVPVAPAYSAFSANPAEDRFYLQTSLGTVHFHPDPDHNDDLRLIYGEWRPNPNVFIGASFFKNSFYQPTQYVFAGWKFDSLPEAPGLYFRVSAGLVHGYKGEYQNKIPFNHHGVAPAIVPAVGYCYGRLCSEVIVFGTSGALLTLGLSLP